jgi:hypothetical protein
MSTVKFLTESTDTPHNASVKVQTLEIPDPGKNEYRRYFNQRSVTGKQVVDDKEVTVDIPCADFVSVQADQEPTDEEWTEVLTEAGYTSEKITEILNA